MRNRLVSIVVVLAALVWIGPVARAENPFFPLQQGWEWEYTGDGGDNVTAWVAGINVVQGIETTVLHWQYSGEVDDYLEQYYTIGNDGAVLIHGFWNQTAELMRSFTPPIVLLPASLTLGAEWCTTVQGYLDLEGTLPDGDPFDLCLRVNAVETVHVPAGDFTAFGVGQFLPPGTDDTKRLTFGRPSGSKDEFSSDWYAAGTGEVILAAYQRFELRSFSSPPTPSRAATWGRLKILYRWTGGAGSLGAER